MPRRRYTEDRIIAGALCAVRDNLIVAAWRGALEWRADIPTGSLSAQAQPFRGRRGGFDSRRLRQE